MELLRNWICGICAVSILIAIAQALAPKNAVSGSVRMIGALIMVIVMLAPIGKIKMSEFRVMSQRTAAELESKTRKINEENQKIKESIIEDSLASYICERAGNRGDDIRVEVTCRDEMPERVTVFLSPGASEKRVVDIIEDECGISRENITVKNTREEG